GLPGWGGVTPYPSSPPADSLSGSAGSLHDVIRKAKAITSDKRDPQLVLPLTARGFRLSARHVQDGVRFLRSLFQRLDGFGGWEDEQCELAASGLAAHILHHRQRSRPGADDQSAALPGDLLFHRNRCVSELIAEFLRGLLLPLSHLPAVDHHVVLIGHTVDPDRTKGKLLEAHTNLAHILSDAGGEDRAHKKVPSATSRTHRSPARRNSSRWRTVQRARPRCRPPRRWRAIGSR